MDEYTVVYGWTGSFLVSDIFFSYDAAEHFVEQSIAQAPERAKSDRSIVSSDVFVAVIIAPRGFVNRALCYRVD